MANKENGEVQVEVAGKQYTLKMTHRGAGIAESVLGRSFFDVDGGGIAYVAALLFAMTEGQHGVKTIDDAYSILDEGDSLAITFAVNEAVTLFFQRHYQAKGEA